MNFIFLKEALGCKTNQLPPFIYMMREFGYPVGWLIEAQVDNTNRLSVHNGDGASEKKEPEVLAEG